MSNNRFDMLYDRIADLDARAADAEARVAELETALREIANLKPSPEDQRSDVDVYTFLATKRAHIARAALGEQEASPPERAHRQGVYQGSAPSAPPRPPEGQIARVATLEAVALRARDYIAQLVADVGREGGELRADIDAALGEQDR